MATYSSTLPWKIPWKEEPGRLQSVGSLRVRHDWATSLSLFLSCPGEGNGNPLQCSCLENPRDGGAWWAAVYRVAQSRTRLKRLRAAGLHEQWLLLLRISEVAAAVPQIITLRELQSWHVTRTPPASYLLDLTSKITPYYSVTPIVRCYFCPKTYYCQA